MNQKIRYTPLFLVTVTLISACDKGTPEPTRLGASPSAAPAIAQAAPVKFGPLSTSKATIAGGACNFDSVGGKDRDLTSFEIDRAAAAKYVGWAALSVEGSAVGNGVQLMLTGTNSGKFVASTHREDRPDVANYFRKPEMKGAGFTVDASMENVPAGEYTLAVLIEQDDKLVECGITKKIVLK